MYSLAPPPNRLGTGAARPPAPRVSILYCQCPCLSGKDKIYKNESAACPIGADQRRNTVFLSLWNALCLVQIWAFLPKRGASWLLLYDEPHQGVTHIVTLATFGLGYFPQWWGQSVTHAHLGLSCPLNGLLNSVPESTGWCQFVTNTCSIWAPVAIEDSPVLDCPSLTKIGEWKVLNAILRWGNLAPPFSAAPRRRNFYGAPCIF